MRTLLTALLALAVAAPLAAQEHMHHQQGAAAAGNGAIAAGWQVRLDRTNASLSNVRFVETADGYHVTLGPSAIFYRPEHTVEGSYTARATFEQTRPTQHPEAYGLLIGGRDLDNANQDYLYFLVRQDGRFLIKHRAGAETHTITDWTEHDVIDRVEDDGSARNTLAIEAGPQRARFLVNGVEVADFRDVPYLNTAGIVGLRINHNLDVRVEDFAVEPAG